MIAPSNTHRNVRLLAWLNFWSGFRLYAPIAILYFSQVAGSYAAGMSVYSVGMLAQSLFEVPTGVISDRVGRRQTVIYGAIADICSLVGYALGGSVPGGSYLILLIGAVFEGLARAFYSGNNDALLYDSLVEHRLTESQRHSTENEQMSAPVSDEDAETRGAYQEFLGKTASAVQIALGISSIIGSLIAALSFSLAMWLSVIPMVLAFLMSLRFSEPRISS
ncbi:MAG TPA: hypothetical protein VHL11_02585, partial [Phototrophicaceae bacterium]|nr:hypothetical protein [Phototrophicaceae bacterium]